MEMVGGSFWCLIVSAHFSLSHSESAKIAVKSYTWSVLFYVIYKALCFDVAQGRMNGAPNETRTWSVLFYS